LAVVTMLGVAPFAAVAACSADGMQQGEQTGTVRMSLTSTTGATVYRLRNAMFDIAGPVSATLDGEVDPNVTVLTVSLPAGTYTSTLRAGWVLQQLDSTGQYVDVEATLISDNPATVEILGGGTRNLVYQFQTNGTIVTIGDGTLAISISVLATGSGGSGSTGACTPFISGTCPAGDWCGVIDTSGTTACIPIGPLTVGSACDGTVNCVQNALCAATGTGAAQCTEVCSLTDPTLAPCSTGTCQDAGIPGEGICAGTTTPPGACTPFVNGTCPTGQWCGVVDSSGTAACIPSGSIPVGGACDGTVPCVQEALCFSTGTGAQCLEVCSSPDATLAPCSTGTCQTFGFPGEGACL
jgi:hypothetical protein